MRVLLCVHAFPPRSTAGVEVYTLRLAKALSARGHDARVLTAVHDLAAPAGAVRRRRHEGVEVVEVVSVHDRGTLAATYDDPTLGAAIGSVLADVRPELVHVQHLLNLSSGLVKAAHGAGARVVMTLHDYWLSCPRDGLRMREDLGLCVEMDHRICAACLTGSPYLVPPLQRGLAGLLRRLGLGAHLHRLHDAAPRATSRLLALLRRTRPLDHAGLAAEMDRRASALRAVMDEVDLVLAPTAFAREAAVAFGVAASKVRVVPLGVLQHPPRRRPSGARRRFGFIGTLAPHKGAHVLLTAFRAVTEPGVTLALHGSPAVDPGYAARLAHAAATDPRVRLCGPFAEGRQDAVLASLDALVLPSIWWENSPMTVLEALGAGLPVIASRIGGVPEIVPEGAGLLVPPGDASALADAIGALARGTLLADARDSLSIKTTSDEAAAMEALYRGV